MEGSVYVASADVVVVSRNNKRQGSLRHVRQLNPAGDRQPIAAAGAPARTASA
jgi:hypothetical protein